MPSPSDQQRPLLWWVRLFDGRLWHLADEIVVPGTVTKCGRYAEMVFERAPEVLEDAPPSGAWICDACVRRSAEQAAAARQAWLADPRRHQRGQLPAPDPDSPPEPENGPNPIPADVTPTTSEEQES